MHDHQALVVEYNATAAPYPSDRTIIDLFRAQVARTPDAEAIRFGDETLTYRQLDERSNQMAAHLTSTGVGPGQIVVVFMEHSIEVVVAILGILKSGAAYVPVDAATPKGRLATILKDIANGTDGRAPVAITQARLQSVISPNLADIFVLDADFRSISTQPELGPAVRCHSGRRRLHHLHLRLDRHAQRRHDRAPEPGELHLVGRSGVQFRRTPRMAAVLLPRLRPDRHDALHAPHHRRPHRGLSRRSRRAEHGRAQGHRRQRRRHHEADAGASRDDPRPQSRVPHGCASSSWAARTSRPSWLATSRRPFPIRSRSTTSTARPKPRWAA